MPCQGVYIDFDCTLNPDPLSDPTGDWVDTEGGRWLDDVEFVAPASADSCLARKNPWLPFNKHYQFRVYDELCCSYSATTKHGGSLEYSIPVSSSGQGHRVVFYFAEYWFSDKGKRLFNIYIISSDMIASSYDIVEHAGGPYQLVTFEAKVPTPSEAEPTFASGSKLSRRDLSFSAIKITSK